MVQAESGGRQFGPNGQILTSPAGAQGQAQIMPATAANPGYGVKPASPEEIASPEGNRAFGQRYYQGLLNHFKGDEAKAVAAYNAGPGRVQKNVQANAGQMNAQQLPQETQGYLQKVLGAVNPIGTANAAAPAPTLQNTP
jgi:soluble lytic murein transglycosylase